MPLSIPPELKPITAYIRRAEELDNDKSSENNPIIAYHCRAFAMEKAMSLRPSNGDSVNSFLMSLMQDLETQKEKISIPREEAKVLCESHAVSLFHRADDEDRGSSDNYREVARTFYNATAFFDILEQFGPLDEEMNNKRTYAKWKATEIMKALKEGRVPTPGGYGGDNAPTCDDDVNSATSGMNNVNMRGNPSPPPSYGMDLPPAPSGVVPNALPTVPGFQMPQQPQYGQSQYGQPQHQPFQQNQQVQPQQQYQPPQQPVHPLQQSQPQHQAPSHQPHPNYIPPQKTDLKGNIADSLELCAFAMAALKHNDTKAAKERLRDALNLL